MARTLFRKKKKQKKPLVIALACLCAAALAVGVVAWTLSRHPDSEDSSLSNQPVKVTHKTLPKEFVDRNTYFPYVALYDITGKEMLYTKNPNAKCYPASLTKLMTAILVCENTTDETVITVGNEVHMAAAGSSRAWLTEGSQLNRTQLVQALMLPSGNDAAYVAAVQVGRILAKNQQLDRYAAVSRFCKEMNKKADALGCTGTHFQNPDGIHESGHYTTAADMVKIAVCALENPVIAKVAAQPKVKTTLLSGQTVEWESTNLLLLEDNIYTYEGATGLKTGTTDEAGYCLAASATRNGRTSIAVVMGSESENGRWDDCSGLLDMSFQ